jgi:hypothetical protein
LTLLFFVPLLQGETPLLQGATERLAKCADRAAASDECLPANERLGAGKVMPAQACAVPSGNDDGDDGGELKEESDDDMMKHSG